MFQKKLKEVTAELKSSDKTIFEAVKTINTYLVDAVKYKKLTKTNVAKVLFPGFPLKIVYFFFYRKTLYRKLVIISLVYILYVYTIYTI